MPNTIDMFDTRTMLGMITEGEKTSRTFFRDRYFRNRPTFHTKRIDFDIVGMNDRKLAPFVHPKAPGNTLDRKGFRTESYEAPVISLSRITTAEDMLDRSPGETIYNAKDPNTRAAEQIGKDLSELDDMITRREEVMCREAILDGKVTIKGEGYDEVVDYWTMAEEDKPTASLVSSSFDEIMQGLRNIRRNMIKKAGFVPTEIICGNSAMDTFLEKIISANVLDTRRVDMGQIDPKMLPNGVTYWGYLKDSALDIYTYDDWYFDDAAGEEVPMMPENKILMASPNVRTSLAYGVIGLVDDDKAVRFYEGARIPQSRVQQTKPAGRILELNSRPLPIVHQPYGFRTITLA